MAMHRSHTRHARLRIEDQTDTVGPHSYHAPAMTDEISESRPAVTPPTAKATRPKRTDDKGRAFAGSQMHLQVWVNRRQSRISSEILRALGITDPDAHVEWLSPVETDGFSEYKDAAFLGAMGLSDHVGALRAFWPSGGPVWDGLARVKRASSDKHLLILVEAKSYPAEVEGNGCQATSPAKERIEQALDVTAKWLGVQRPSSWMGALYQSANRIAHVYFLRERLGLDAVMVNVCFIDDPRRPTTAESWNNAKIDFRKRLQLNEAVTPWLVDVFLSAAAREELLPLNGVS